MYPFIHPELMLEYLTVLRSRVNIGFTRYDGFEGPVYFDDSYQIVESDDTIWENTRKSPNITRLLIEEALLKVCQRNNVIFPNQVGDESTNNQRIQDFCRITVGRFIDEQLELKIQQG